MKRFLVVILINLPTLLLSANVFAIGCTAISVDTQTIVRDKNNPPPIQSSTATHIQDENCYMQSSFVRNNQYAVAPEVEGQYSDTIIIQDTPAKNNPYRRIVPADTGNVSLHLAIQTDLATPSAKQLRQTNH